MFILIWVFYIALLIVIAYIFRFFFRIRYFRKFYFGFYKRLFKSKNLFKGLSLISSYDENLKMKLDLDEWIQQNVFFFGVYDPVNIQFLKKNLNPGDTFIDVGANVGCFSLVAARELGPNGRVIAFEPITIVADRLEENILLNGFKNIKLERKAIYSKETTLSFFIASQENLGMSSIKHHDTESGNIQEAEAIRLDKYLENNDTGNISMIKIDIEGAEIPAIRGMQKTIQKHQPILMVEVSSSVTKDLDERKEVFKLFDHLSYDFFVLDKQSKPVSVSFGEIDHYTNFIFYPKKPVPQNV